MIKVKAKIKLYKGECKRETPFKTGYRPHFKFDGGMKTSGSITLVNQEHFLPDEEGVVEINFVNRESLGQSFGVGKSFYFYEGEEPLGEGQVLEFL
jgi:translation elongation factor EF-Tu-like GTPase